jgi:glycosyltransferase involved in cell wall biosynthesis
MAVYGRDDAGLLERAIRSVFQNTVPPDDFVLAVDGPVPPAIDAVIERFEGSHRIRVLRVPENVGLARALNEGLALVTTEWIARADADDVNVADRFERQARAAASGSVDVVGGVIEEIDSSGEPLAVRMVPMSHDQIVGMLSKRSPFNHMTVAYRAPLLRRVGGYPQVYLKEDYALWGVLVAAGARCANLPDILVRATAGRDHVQRRGGLRYVRSEWELQLHLWRLGLKSLGSAVFWGAVRGAVFCMPVALRGFVYERFLRRPARSGS